MHNINAYVTVHEHCTYGTEHVLALHFSVTYYFCLWHSELFNQDGQGTM